MPGSTSARSWSRTTAGRSSSTRPRGRNHGHATYLRALEADTWFCEKLTVDDTGLITPAQIEEERRAGMSDGKIGQEFYCSFDADIDEQLIPHDLVSAAMARKPTAEAWEEKVIGVDVARFGDDKSALYFRHGRDGNPRPYERYAGLDTMALAAKVAERISIWSPDAVFVDDGGVGGGVVDRLHQLGFRQVIGVNFGGKADRGGTGLRAGNKRSEMWLSAREWLQRGALPRDELLAAELTAPMYAYPVVEDIRSSGHTSPADDRRRTQRPRHVDAARRALARLDGHEPARPARAPGAAMRQSRVMSLVEAIANVVVGLIVAVASRSVGAAK